MARQSTSLVQTSRPHSRAPEMPERLAELQGAATSARRRWLQLQGARSLVNGQGAASIDWRARQTREADDAFGPSAGWKTLPGGPRKKKKSAEKKELTGKSPQMS